MPESPDFESIARRIVDGCSLDDMAGVHKKAVEADAVTDVVEQLRQVWNARGAADLATLTPILGANIDDLYDAIHGLDR